MLSSCRRRWHGRGVLRLFCLQIILRIEVIREGDLRFGVNVDGLPWCRVMVGKGLIMVGEVSWLAVGLERL